MAVTSSSNASATLRAITYRITTAAPEQLPLLATQVSGLIWNCREILSASADSLGSKSETTALIHRFRTKITSLLQDRTIEGRWAAVVLTKAAIEAGGVEFLGAQSTGHPEATRSFNDEVSGRYHFDKDLYIDLGLLKSCPGDHDTSTPWLHLNMSLERKEGAVLCKRARHDPRSFRHSATKTPNHFPDT